MCGEIQIAHLKKIYPANVVCEMCKFHFVRTKKVSSHLSLRLPFDDGGFENVVNWFVCGFLARLVGTWRGEKRYNSWDVGRRKKEQQKETMFGPPSKVERRKWPTGVVSLSATQKAQVAFHLFCTGSIPTIASHSPNFRLRPIGFFSEYLVCFVPLPSKIKTNNHTVLNRKATDAVKVTKNGEREIGKTSTRHLGGYESVRFRKIPLKW